MKPIAVIIINFSNSRATLDCLDSLKKADLPIQVILIQYESNKELYSKIEGHKLKPLIIKERKNLGFAGFNNLGIRRAIEDKFEWALILNNDTIVSSNFLKPLLNRLKNDPKIALVSPKIYFAKGYETHQYPAKYLGKVIWYGGGVNDWRNALAFHRFIDEVDRGQANEASETDFASGCATLFRTKSIGKIGMMPEKYFLYYEDNAWSQIAKAKGYQVWYEPGSYIWHKNAQSTEGAGSKVHRYYQTRNRILFAREFAPTRTKGAVWKNAWSQYRKGQTPENIANLHGLIGKSGYYQIV